MKHRATVNISLEAKSQLDAVKSAGQSYDGIIRELVEFWQERRSEYWSRGKETKTQGKK